jgi:hypothetical protein
MIKKNSFGRSKVSGCLRQMPVIGPDAPHNTSQDACLAQGQALAWASSSSLDRIAPDVGERCALRMVDELCAASFLEKLNTAGTP